MFTREVATKALPDKSAQTVTRAAAEIIPKLVQDESNYVVTTDMGNEFRGLEATLPAGVVQPAEGSDGPQCNGGGGPSDANIEEGPGG